MSAKSLTLGLLCLLLTASETNAAATFDQPFSTDGLAPTELGVLMPGVTTIIGNVSNGAGNPDFFTFEIASGMTWSGLDLLNYQSSDNLAALLVNDSNTFPLGVVGGNPPQAVLDQIFAGRTIGPGNVGDSLFPIFDGNGFVQNDEFGSGTYTVLVQQLSGSSTDYSLGITVTAVPEPSSLAVLGFLGGGAALRRRFGKRR